MFNNSIDEIEISNVKEIGSNYVIIIDDNNNKYRLKLDNNYEIGDRVNIILKNIKKGTPNTGEIIKIDTVSTSMDFSITDVIENENSNNKDNKIPTNENIEQSNKETTSNNIDTNNNTIYNENIINNNNNEDPEIAVLNYFNDFSNEVDNSDSLKKTLKEKFVLVVDFLFYDGTIKNTTFKELSTKTKLKVLQIFLKIDNKIENKFPGYKETITTTGNKVYTNAKNKALEIYFDLTTDICSKDPELCKTKNGTV